MSTRRSRDWQWRAALVLAVSCGLARGAEPGASAELERITRERAAIEHNAQIEKAACAQRFGVTSCVERVRAERRHRLLELNREQADLDDARRMQRAAERAPKLPQRKADPSPPPRDKAAREPKPPASAPPARRADRQASAAAERALRESQAQAAAARRAQASARRASQAQAHRAYVEKRNVDRAASRAPSKLPPVPPAASASQ